MDPGSLDELQEMLEEELDLENAERSRTLELVKENAELARKSKEAIPV